MEALRTVLEREVSICLRCQFFQQFRAICRDLFDLLPAFPKDLLALCHRSRVVEMDHRVRRSFDSLKGFLDNVLSCLCQHLYRHIVGYHLPLDQSAHKLILRLRCRRKTYLDFLESNLHKHLKKLQFFFEAHRLDQCLVSVSQIDRTPDRRRCDRILFHPVICTDRG